MSFVKTTGQGPAQVPSEGEAGAQVNPGAQGEPGVVQALTGAGAQTGNAAGVVATLLQGDATAAAAGATLGGTVGVAGGGVPGIAGGMAGGAAGGVLSAAGAVPGSVSKHMAGAIGGVAGMVDAAGAAADLAGAAAGKASGAVGNVAGVASGVIGGGDLPFFEDKAITSMAGKAAQAIGGIAGVIGGAFRKVLGGGDSNLEVEVASGDDLHVRSFSVLQRLSSLFEVNLLVRSENPSIDFDEVVGQPARFSLHSGPHDRFWAGLCNHMELVGVDPDGLSTYQLTIVPALWLLSQRKNYRMFQQISEPDIVLRILEEWGIEPDVRIDKAAYKKRKYRVQYAESDLAFVHRMLEDAGIGYFFEQVKSESKLVLTDAPQSNPPRQPPLPFMDDVTAVRKVEVEFATAVRMSQRVRPGKVSLRDHDYRRPANYKLMKTAAAGRGVEEKLERYHYIPGAFLFGAEQGEATPVADDKGKARTDEKEGALVAQKRLDAKRGTAKVCSFDTNAHDLAPGVVVSIVGHPHAALGRKLLIVQSSLAGSDTGEWSHQCEARGVDIPYRPELVTPKPKVNGVESATVVGPPGEEIHTDEFGRVRVHFHWDRESKMDDSSSCWIHVSQPWGGAGYGATNLPRVGQEVLVDFLGGDPDRPVVVGRVYTNLQKTPYKLPENKTQSGWKSNSTGGGGGYNEIMFEDAAGRELVRVQAQKDLNKLVKNNETEVTGADRTIAVGKNRNATIGEVDSALVGKQHTVTIAQPAEPPPKIPPTGTAMTDQNVSQTTGLATLNMAGPDVTLTAAGNITLNAGANITLNAGANIVTTAATSIIANAGVLISNTAGVSITTVAGAVVTVKAGALVSVEASSVAVKGDQVEITASGPVDINGAVIDLN